MPDGIDWNVQVAQAASGLNPSDTVKLFDPIFAIMIKDGWDKDIIVAMLQDISKGALGKNVLSLLYDRYIERTRSV